MTQYYQTPDATFHHGNSLAILNNDIPEASVQLCVTSPPYYGLRKYSGVEPSIWDGDALCDHQWETDIVRGISGGPPTEKMIVGGEVFQRVPDSEFGICLACGAMRCCLGNEPTLQDYIHHLVLILRGVHSVLRPDGILCINVGTSYSGGGTGGDPASVVRLHRERTNDKARGVSLKSTLGGKGVPDTDKIASLARPDRPSSDLPAKSDMLVPQRLAIAMQDDGWVVRHGYIAWQKQNSLPESVSDRLTNSTEAWIVAAKSSDYYWNGAAVRRGSARQEEGGYSGLRQNDDRRDNGRRWVVGATRNMRVTDVWTDSVEDEIAYHQERLNHLRHIRDNGGMAVDASGEPMAIYVASEGLKEKHFAAYPTRMVKQWILAGSREGDVVLDPFLGSGTTAACARTLNRRAVGIDASDEYLDIAVRRFRITVPTMFEVPEQQQAIQNSLFTSDDSSATMLVDTTTEAIGQ